MVIVSFSAINPNGQCQNLSFAAKSAEACFKMLTELTVSEWQLIHANLVCGEYRISLPIEAFDGEDMDVPIKKLRQEWETLLF